MEAQVLFLHIRPSPTTDLGTEALCGSERNNRDTTRPEEAQTEIWENQGQLQGYNIPLQTKTNKTKQKNAHLQYRFCLSFKASLKEAELRQSDIRKARIEFERRVLKPMKDNKLEMKEPEKVLQYIEDKLKVTVRFSPMMMSTFVKYLKHLTTHLNLA